MLKPFKVQELGELDDGREALRINQLVANAVRDCTNRPGANSARKVTITMSIKPVQDDMGVCREVDVEIESKLRVPANFSKTYAMQARPMGGLLFNAASPSDPSQATLDELGDGSRVNTQTGEVMDDED